MNIRFNSLLLAMLFMMPLGASMIQNDIPAVAFYVPFDEGTGSTPAFSGTGGSGTLTCTDLGWDAGPPVAASGNGTTTICAATPTVNLNTSTLSACINPSGWGENNAGYILHSDASGTQPTRGVSFFIQSTNSVTGSFVLDTGGGVDQFNANNSMTVGDATWKHVLTAISNCGTLGSGCTGRIWVDGVEKAITTSGVGTGTKNADTNIRLLNRIGSDRTWQGTMREIRLYTSAFDQFQAEFTSNNANCAGSSTPSPAVTETDCDALMTSYLAAQGLTADPFERSAGFQNGDGCAIFAQVPTR